MALNHPTLAAASSGGAAAITWILRLIGLDLPAEVIGAIAVILGYLIAVVRERRA